MISKKAWIFPGLLLLTLLTNMIVMLIR